MSDAGNIRSLSALFRAYRGRLLLTYVLFNLENVLRLTQPMFLGWAVSDLFAASMQGVLLLLGHQLTHLLLSGGRRMYDTRTFTAMYTMLAADFVMEQRDRGVCSSQVAARSALSRQIVDFFERDVPFLFHAAYSLVGALVLLGCYDLLLVPCCVALFVPAWLLSRAYGRKTQALNRRLHDEMEKEVEVIGRGDETEVVSHYRSLASWRVRLSDAEARTFAVMELAALMPLGVALLRSCADGAADAGRISAVVGYVLMFVIGLTNLPVLAEQWGRLVDICQRLRHAPAVTEAKSCDRSTPVGARLDGREAY